MWWAAAVLVWLVSAAWIFYLMADVFRGKSPALSPKMYPGYIFHGVTAVLALFLMMKAVG